MSYIPQNYLYVDDFVILSNSFDKLVQIRLVIDIFLREKLRLELHPTKSRIILLHRGVEFLGFKTFPHHLLIKRKNLKKFYKKLARITFSYSLNKTDYDAIYNFMEGWLAYARHTNTYRLRQKILNEFEHKFSGEISCKEITRAKT